MENVGGTSRNCTGISGNGILIACSAWRLSSTGGSPGRIPSRHMSELAHPYQRPSHCDNHRSHHSCYSKYDQPIYIYFSHFWLVSPTYHHSHITFFGAAIGQFCSYTENIRFECELSTDYKFGHPVHFKMHYDLAIVEI